MTNEAFQEQFHQMQAAIQQTLGKAPPEKLKGYAELWMSEGDKCRDEGDWDRHFLYLCAVTGLALPMAQMSLNRDIQDN